MTEKTIIYHNPRCSKSRAALLWLQNNAEESELEVIEYLKQPVSRESLLEIISELQIQPRDIIRSGEALYKELNLKDNTLSDSDLIDSIVANPILLERPIVRYQGRAAIGRPLDNIIELFE